MMPQPDSLVLHSMTAYTLIPVLANQYFVLLVFLFNSIGVHKILDVSSSFKCLAAKGKNCM